LSLSSRFFYLVHESWTTEEDLRKLNGYRYSLSGGANSRQENRRRPWRRMLQQMLCPFIPFRRMKDGQKMIILVEKDDNSNIILVRSLGFEGADDPCEVPDTTTPFSCVQSEFCASDGYRPLDKCVSGTPPRWKLYGIPAETHTALWASFAVLFWMKIEHSSRGHFRCDRLREQSRSKQGFWLTICPCLPISGPRFAIVWLLCWHCWLLCWHSCVVVLSIVLVQREVYSSSSGPFLAAHFLVVKTRTGTSWGKVNTTCRRILRYWYWKPVRRRRRQNFT